MDRKLAEVFHPWEHLRDELDLMIHKDNVHYFDGLQEMIDKKGLQPDEHGFYMLTEFTLSVNSDEQISDFIS